VVSSHLITQPQDRLAISCMPSDPSISRLVEISSRAAAIKPAPAPAARAFRGNKFDCGSSRPVSPTQSTPPAVAP